MKKKPLIFLIFVAAFQAATVYAAPRYQYGQESSIAIREMQASIDELRHEMNNHESEIRTFEDKLNNQEVVIEALREQNLKQSKSSQDTVKNNISNLEMKINGLDTATKGLISDFKELKNHANQSGIPSKIAEIEKVLEIHTQNLENFSAALRSLMSILEVKHDLNVASESKDKVYKVQAGDSLEKIAKVHKTSVKAIKDINDLNSDRIIVGQNIKIP